MKLFKKTQGRPLQLVLVVPFVIQIFAAVGLVGYLSFRNGQKSVGDLAEELTHEVANNVEGHLDNYLSVPHKVNQLNADAIKMELLDVGDRQTTSQYFWRQMQVYDLTYVGFGLTTGEGAGAARYDGQTITIDDWTGQLPNNTINYQIDAQGNRTVASEPFDFDNFSESWYTEPIKAGKPVWSKIYTWLTPDGHPYITASAGRPIYDANQKLLGMVAADIHLLKLSEFLRDLNVERAGQVFIVEQDGMLIANSNSHDPFNLADGEITRIKAADSPDPLVRDIAQQLQQSFNGFQSINEDQNIQIKLNGDRYFIDARPWNDEYGLRWVTVVAVPQSAFMGQIYANTRTTVVLCVGALFIATAIGLVTSRRITQSIQRLNRASADIASGNWEKSVEGSDIQELETLARSFNHMAKQLRESFTSLKANNEELEDRVENRTQALQETLSELQRTQLQMIQSEKMSGLGQLVAGVAHEINNPVNFIHGNLSYVEGYSQDLLNIVALFQQHYPNPPDGLQTDMEDAELDFMKEDFPKVVASMKMGTERIREIVLSLRNFSRMDEAEMKAVDVHEGIESTLTILQNRLKAHSERPEIEVIREYGQLPMVECYAGQLNQAFMNILSNAIDALETMNESRRVEEIKANPNKITIRTAVLPDQQVEIAITDNGPGIPEDVRSRVFDPFFTTKPIGQGTGMGMSISYSIVVDRHKGSLKCAVTDQGTEFTIQIPTRQRLADPVAARIGAEPVAV